MNMELVETRVSGIKPGDLWLLDGGWVQVTAVDPAPHPDDRVWVMYIQDGEVDTDSTFHGFEVAVVKREQP